MFLTTFEKTQATSLPWFSTQQQTSTVNRQKSDFFYANFSLKLNEISFFFRKASGRDSEMAKTKVVQKKVSKRCSETNS